MSLYGRRHEPRHPRTSTHERSSGLLSIHYRCHGYFLSTLSMHPINNSNSNLFVKGWSSNIANWWRLKWKRIWSAWWCFRLLSFFDTWMAVHPNILQDVIALIGLCKTYLLDLGLNLKKMTTDSAIGEVSKVCTRQTTSRIGFLDWFRSIWSPDVFRKNPVNPVTGFGPRPVFAIDGKRRGQDQY
jgi:hypothetical protein